MEWKEWTQDEVRKSINRIKKNGKQPSPDRKKDEMKWLKDDPICLEKLTQCKG